jgi:hypothetical protein
MFQSTKENVDLFISINTVQHYLDDYDTSLPPVTNTFPFANVDALCDTCGIFIIYVAVHPRLCNKV